MTSIPEDGCTFSVGLIHTAKFRRIVLERTNQYSRSLLKEWRRGLKIPGEAEHAINDRYQGFQVLSVDCAGKTQLEGMVLYAEKPYGIYLRALETAPWNRDGLRFRGIATVLVARLAMESEMRGHAGVVCAIPTSSVSELFNRICGFIYFPEYAKNTGLLRENYPLGYEEFMVLDTEASKRLIAGQLSRRGAVAVDDETLPSGALLSGTQDNTSGLMIPGLD